jgi:hypothetical protein
LDHIVLEQLHAERLCFQEANRMASLEKLMQKPSP